MFSTDVWLAFAPETTYRRLVVQSDRSVWYVAVRPALVLLALAVILPMMATHSITLGLVLTSAMAWSVIVAIQIMLGVLFIVSTRTRSIRMSRALDLWFAGHVPYTLWILLLPAITSVVAMPPLDAMGLTVVVPLVWTTFILTAFCRVVLDMTPSHARWRTSMHLALVLIVGSALALWAVGGSPALFSYIVRRLATSA